MKKIKILFKMFYLYHKAAYDPLLDVFTNDPKFDVAISLTNEVKRSFGFLDRQQSDIYLNQFQKEGYRISDEDEQFDIVIVPDVVDESKFGITLLCVIYHGFTFTKTVTFRELNKHRDQRYMIFA
ncbi:MAG: CDP-glycerol glycerophosphotransferase, partial [Candidatus Marinimicrobia bacterium]|nr:CDP-glycerol glycerophosphotransferase [Candidatus Neomarinimicrobiota bacterium]